MGDKVQGEGDYESARNYREDTERSIREREKNGKSVMGNAAEASDELTPAEREGRSRAREPGQDARDADCMDRLERKKEG
ncbi:MAG TPA: hypothetical protein VFG73_03515 [Rhodanobacteraceae bacterium]|nr:hypothetical protein [Rhodanobacteraceae bacterium]